MLESFGATLERVVVTELRDSTFFAELHLNAFGAVHVVSSRPSDAIAIRGPHRLPHLRGGIGDGGGRCDRQHRRGRRGWDDPDEVVEEFRHSSTR